MSFILPILLSACVQSDDKLRELEGIRQKMAAEIKEYESLVKDMKAHYQSIEETMKALKSDAPKKDGGLLDEVRALRKEVAELRGIVKELIVGGHSAGSMKLAPVEKHPPKKVEEGRLTLKLGDAEGLKEIEVWVEGRDEPLRFTLKKAEKKEKAEKKDKPDKSDKPRKEKPISDPEPPACEECPFQGECPLDPGLQAGVWY